MKYLSKFSFDVDLYVKYQCTCIVCFVTACFTGSFKLIFVHIIKKYSFSFQICLSHNNSCTIYMALVLMYHYDVGIFLFLINNVKLNDFINI